MVTEEVVMPAELTGFSPAIDRVDVGIRAVMLLFKWGKWSYLNQLGLTRTQQWPIIYPNGKTRHVTTEDLLYLATDTIGTYRTDEQIAALLRLCPFLLAAALEALRLYIVKTASSRRQFQGVW